MPSNQDQNQLQDSATEDPEFSSESRQKWVSMAIAAATASLRASAPAADSSRRFELKTDSV